MNDKVIDIRGKDKEKVLEGYGIVASESSLQEEIWKQTNSLDGALKLYRKLVEKKDKTESETKSNGR